MNWHHAKMFNYEYAFCPSKKEWDTYWTKGGSTPPKYLNSHGRATFFQTTDKDGWVTPRALVTVAEDSNITPLMLVSLLAHEAVHIKQDMCERIGEDKISSEMEAYIVQTVLQDMLYDYRDTRL